MASAFEPINIYFDFLQDRPDRGQPVARARLGIDSDVRLHPEVPLVPLLRLVHSRVACLARVLRRTRRSDEIVASTIMPARTKSPPDWRANLSNPQFSLAGRW